MTYKPSAQLRFDEMVVDQIESLDLRIRKQQVIINGLVFGLITTSIAVILVALT